MRKHLVLSSIACESGHFWETIWNDAANTELRQIRQSPNVLLPEDRVHVPELRQKEEIGQTEMRHRFVRMGEPFRFRLRLLDGRQRPRSGVEYRIEVDDGVGQFVGTTDANGWLEELPIRGDARQARLFILSTGEMHDLRYGELDPVRSIAGQKARLQNLGFFAGPIDNEPSDELRTALRRFQTTYQANGTAEPNAATQERLREVHKS